ncbi:MAG: long-chain fatty acid--CoA ligase [Myxococcota bacterium]|nr:long-chain fatty acid--CoA ligase [Myxococcota bacterium]
MSDKNFQSVAAMFLHRVQTTPDAEAFYYPDEEDIWQTRQWKDVGVRARSIACGLHALGLESENRASILCNTCVDWILVDLGILAAGGATTTIYPSSTAEDCEYIINDSGTRWIFVEDEEQTKKILSVQETLPALEKIIVIKGKKVNHPMVISLSELEEQGNSLDQKTPDLYQNAIQSIQPHHLATLIYTSGTTGRPKGVELLQDCWIFEAEAMCNLGFLTPADKQFLWLPLSHSFGKVLEVMLIRIGIPTAIDGRIDKIGENLQLIKPTFVAAVPRIFEKLYNKIVSGAQEGSALKYRIFRWSLEVGQEVSALTQRGLEPKGVLRLKSAMANLLVFSKIKARLGGELKFFISGSAPLSYDIATFFHAAGVLILEGYGLTESSAASFVNRPDNYKFGTVGKPVPGVEFKLAEEDDEILLKGRGIMRGYYNLPDKSAETLDEGWLRTGDIGRMDSDGFLRVVDRKKDLIKTSGGKYVAPQKIEGKLKSLCPFVSQALVHGNARNFCTMLLTLDEEHLLKWAEKAGLESLSYEKLCQLPEITIIIQQYIDQLNQPLASYETIKKFAILPTDFSIEGGELTPSMKVKRKVVETKYKDVLDGFYTSALKEM